MTSQFGRLGARDVSASKRTTVKWLWWLRRRLCGCPVPSCLLCILYIIYPYNKHRYRSLTRASHSGRSLGHWRRWYNWLARGCGESLPRGLLDTLSVFNLPESRIQAALLHGCSGRCTPHLWYVCISLSDYLWHAICSLCRVYIAVVILVRSGLYSKFSQITF